MSDEVKILEQKEVRSTSAKIISAVIEGLVILMTLVLVMMIRTYWLETAVVISGSMKPTLQVDCRLVVDHRDALHGTWKRGDIVVFNDPPHWPAGTYIKRIVAVPGDVIQINNGIVAINGKVLSEPYVAREAAGGRPASKQFGPWRMEEHQYFMMGDNRGNSEDSRVRGPVPDKAIRGRAIFQLWPLSGFGKLH
jgi:signal peptidase I